MTSWTLQRPASSDGQDLGMMIATIFAGDDEDAEKDTDWSKNTEEDGETEQR